MSDMSRRILVVDDEEDIQTFLCDVFRDAGWTVDSAQNGLEALERIEQCRPDLVLLDIVMPVVDGWGVLERLRQTPRPLAFSSSRASPTPTGRCRPELPVTLRSHLRSRNCWKRARGSAAPSRGSPAPFSVTSLPRW